MTKLRFIPLERVFIGQQSGYSLEEWIEQTHEYERISVLLKNSPYISIIKTINSRGDFWGDSQFVYKTDYYQMAKVALEHTGHFFEATEENDIINVIKRYYNFYESRKNGSTFVEKDAFAEGRSPKGSLVTVKKIKDSRYYEIIDGHHRMAISYLLGKKYVLGIVREKNNNYLQNLVLTNNQTQGRRELYQPIESPEVSTWPVVRICTDRFSLMSEYLQDKKIETGTMVDLACSYGFFVKKFKERGFKVRGVDRDKPSLRICHEINKLTQSELKQDKVEVFLERAKADNRQFDVVLFLSIFHHFVIGKEVWDPREILRNLDLMTKKVLFFDTGQNHEAWYKKQLTDWSQDYILKYLRAHTNFREIKVLGHDSDNQGAYKNYYQRALFVCYK